jgi:hypothetical protein
MQLIALNPTNVWTNLDDDLFYKDRCFVIRKQDLSKFHRAVLLVIGYRQQDLSVFPVIERMQMEVSIENSCVVSQCGWLVATLDGCLPMSTKSTQYPLMHGKPCFLNRGLIRPILLESAYCQAP